MINHVHIDYQQLKQINLSDRRLYETPSGKRYPSITTVLGKTADNSWLQDWENIVGAEEAFAVSKRAANRGTALHELCEEYLRNNNPKPTTFDIEAFNQAKQVLVDIDNVYAIERQLHSDKFETAGTVDLIAEYKGKLSVLDWKTSNRVKNREDIPGYFIQASFYALSMYETYKIPVANIVIAMMVDGERKPLIFEEKVKTWVPEFIKIREKFRTQEGY